MKSVVLFVVVVFMCLAIDSAYGLGGGGRHGDGRTGFSQSPGNGNAPIGSNGNTGGVDNGSVIPASPASPPSVSVPEPVALSLLGLGIVGLVGLGLRRKFRK